MVNKLIVALIALVIGLALTPVVGSFATSLTRPLITATTSVGYTGTASVVQEAGQFTGTTVGSLVDILPILYVIILIVACVTFIALKKNA